MNLPLPTRPLSARAPRAAAASCRGTASRQGMTLVEYIGVLVVVGLITGILTPRVLAALENARLNQTILDLKAVRAAALDYFGEARRWNALRSAGAAASTTNWADVLYAESLLASPFAPPLGDHATVEVLTVPPDATPGKEGCFDLSGTGTATTLVGSQVVVARLAAVSATEAWALSRRFDGSVLSAPDELRADTLGRVTYPAGGGTVTVYLVHQPAAASPATGTPGEAAGASISPAAATTPPSRWETSDLKSPRPRNSAM